MRPKGENINRENLIKRRIQQSFSFENNLAHLVEHLSVKQSVIGSSPIIISFAPCLWVGSSVGRAQGWSPWRRKFKSYLAHQLQGLIRSIIFCSRVKAEWNPFPYISEIYGTKNYYLWGVFYTRLFKFAFLPHSFFNSLRGLVVQRSV